MASLVAAVAASHAPGITGFPDRAAPAQAATVHKAFADAAAHLRRAEPDLVVGVSVEHFTNFFVDNLPTFAVCTGEGFVGPATSKMAEFLDIRQRTYKGDPPTAQKIYGHALGAGFDPSLVVGGFRFDENFTVPLTLLDVANLPVVPIIVNAVNPPYPSLRRCYALGRVLAGAIAGLPEDRRVALIATGGLSHWVGMPESGTINDAFDRNLLSALADGDVEAVLQLTDDQIDAAGNGAHEIRAWIVLAGATSGAPVDVLAYEPVPEWLTGTSVTVSRLTPPILPRKGLGP